MAWLSLEEGDSQPASFWTYVITALQQGGPRRRTPTRWRCCSRSAAADPDRPGHPPQRALRRAEPTSTWCSTTTTSSTDRTSRAGMTFLLEHLPPNVHLVISTRADPALPLARLRARGELVEIRAGDLRFTPDEVADYLNAVSRPRAWTPPTSRRWRRARKGGSPRSSWPRSRCRGDDDVRGFIAGFAGDDRYIVDYLVEEVLARQPEPRPQLPDRHLHPGPAHRPAVRRRHRRPGGKAMLESAGAGQPVRGPARRAPPLVPLPPPVRRRPADPPDRRATRRRSRPAPPGQPVVRGARGDAASRAARPGRGRRRPRGRSSSSSPSPACNAPGRTAPSAAGSTSSPTRWCGSDRCSRSCSSER